jgi:rhodanese-related sulfurtransferase
MAASDSNINRIAVRDAHSADDVLLLDVRTPVEFEDTHIEGAVLHPLADLDADAVAKLAAGKSACVLVCGSGGRASKAAEKLAASGLASVRVLDGGVRAWAAAELPLVRGHRAFSLERQVRIGAGALVAVGMALGWVAHPGWFILPAFVGCGLVFAGVTDFCGMGIVLAKMPWNRRRGKR